MPQPVPYITGPLAPLYAMKHKLANVLIFTDSFWSRSTTTQSTGNFLYREITRLFKPDAWAGTLGIDGDNTLPVWVSGDGGGVGVIGSVIRNPYDVAGPSGLTGFSPKVSRETQFSNTTLTGDVLCMRRYMNAANGFPWTGGAWFGGKTLTFRAIYYTHANGCNGLNLVAFSPTIGTRSSATVVNQRNATAGVNFSDAVLAAGTITGTSLIGIDVTALSGTTFANNSFFIGIGQRIFDASATTGLQLDFCGYTGMFMQRLLDMITQTNLRAYNAATSFATGANIWYIAVGRNDAGQGETKSTYKTKLQNFMAQAPAGTQFILQSPHSNPTDDAWLVQVADAMNEISAARTDTTAIDMYRAFADATMNASTLNFSTYLDDGLHLNGIGVHAFAGRLVGLWEAGAAGYAGQSLTQRRLIGGA